MYQILHLNKNYGYEVSTSNKKICIIEKSIKKNYINVFLI